MAPLARARRRRHRRCPLGQAHRGSRSAGGSGSAGRPPTGAGAMPRPDRLAAERACRRSRYRHCGRCSACAAPPGPALLRPLFRRYLTLGTGQRRAALGSLGSRGRSPSSRQTPSEATGSEISSRTCETSAGATGSMSSPVCVHHIDTTPASGPRWLTTYDQGTRRTPAPATAIRSRRIALAPTKSRRPVEDGGECRDCGWVSCRCGRRGRCPRPSPR